MNPNFILDISLVYTVKLIDFYMKIECKIVTFIFVTFFGIHYHFNDPYEQKIMK